MDITTIPELVAGLSSDDDSTRKMAVFKLQSAIGDPAFADVFLQEGGGPKLAKLSLTVNGNTLAYALTTYSRLLDLDKGWDQVTPELIERAVQLVVTQPLVNILRSAVSLLVAVVSRPYNANRNSTLSNAQAHSHASGFRALKPAVAIHPQFLQMLVSMLSSAEHLLCANALQLINSLVRDTVMNNVETEWPMFIKRLQDLGVIKAVYVLMQSTALQDMAQPILEFQSLTKIMLRKWRQVRVDLTKSDHKRAIRSISAASYSDGDTFAPKSGSKQHRDPERWRRVGFESEGPGPEFIDTGFLGMMDLTDFVMKNEDQFRKLVLEQAAKPAESRCPIAKASLAVTLALFDHFEIEKAEADDSHRHAVLESRTNFEKAFKPLLLHWSRLHTAGLNAFFRLWKTTCARSEDFDRIAELVKILIEQVVGQASRTKDVVDAEEEMVDFDYKRLRELQMELLELTYEDAWGHHLRQVRDELNHEALQFVKEQRIRCLLQGSWFPNTNHRPVNGSSGRHHLNGYGGNGWRFVRLSHNRRHLHYGDYSSRSDIDPSLDDLVSKIDLTVVSSVVSNVSANTKPSTPNDTSNGVGDSNAVAGAESRKSPKTAKFNANGTKPNGITSESNGTVPSGSKSPTGTTITINKFLSGSRDQEAILLQLHPQTHTLASEWLDGLLMLLSQQPITAETNKLVNLIGGYGLKIRLLNVRYEDLEAEEPTMPTREGLDEDYYYDIGGMETGA